MRLNSISMVVLGFLVFSTQSSFAFLQDQKVPSCFDKNTEIQVDNDRVLKFKTGTKNQFTARGYISGTIITQPELKNDHSHFIIQIGPGSKDTIEVIYNISPEFGEMAPLNVGDSVSVCGDYITSYARAGGYDPSPAGALIHWVHYNPANRSGSMNHEHGFIMSGSTLIGFDRAPADDWNGKIIPQPASLQ